MRVVVAVVTLSILTTSACSLTPTRHKGAAAIADVSAIATGALYLQASNCEEIDGNNRIDCLDDGLQFLLVGGALTVIAAVAGGYALSGLTSTDAKTTAPVAPVAPVVLMPRRPTDAETERLALQAQRAAGRGQCGATRDMMSTIAGRDAAYHADLAVVPSIAACLR